MLVRFIRDATPYQGGEVAGFRDEEARRLISMGVAAEHSPIETQEIKPKPRRGRPPKTSYETKHASGDD